MCHKMCLVMRFHRAVCGYEIEKPISGVPEERKACFVIFQNLKRSDKHKYKIDTPRRMGKEDGGETSRGRDVRVGPPMET